MTGIHRKIFFKSDNCPSWWPKDVVFSPVRGIIVGSTHSHTVDVFKFCYLLCMLVFMGSKAGVTAVSQRKILAAFLENCPEQYTM